ncbi:Adenosylcobalamin-dependent ribonucleoside-triphosphate reductase [bioreactor metagenome]|uniref:ribonucleoside-triphosphate reductase (thioredoxin) n=1 Tax=bioreactor metagenome TaxID=1076179 RepID=A0A644Z7X6_9ZZZZ
MLLTNEFIKKYEAENPMMPLGSFVYYRTYSRWLPEKGRRETWLETVRRAVEYNCSLDKNTSKEEAEALFDNIYNLRSFLSGRTFWIGGTEAVHQHPLANFNCSGIVINKFEKLHELFYALMVGTGAGFRILEEDVEYLPTVRRINTVHKDYQPRKKAYRQENTSIKFKRQNTQAVIHIGDSKEGWCTSLQLFLDIVSKREYDSITEVIFEYDSIRPKGERLKKFGGTASGHAPLVELFTKFTAILNARVSEAKFREKLHAIDLLDFANIIASIVVVGGVRRSAEIGMFGAEQTDCIQAKNNLYTQDAEGNWVINKAVAHRSLSNNTIIHWKKPDREFWNWQFAQMRFSGEPAFYNGEQALRRNSNFKLTNPCGEVLLDDQQTCNLVTNNVMAFVDENGNLDKEALLKAQYLNARASYRLTLVELELPDWNYKLHRDRLLGVSLTGWQDMVNAIGMTKEEQRVLLRELRQSARNGADSLAEELGLNKSLLVTTLKPEGTLSLLPTVSSGLHFSHAPYYIRRIRINAHDPLAKVCMMLGYSVQPEVGQDWATATTLVIEFPVKSPDGRTKYDVSAIEQLEIYKMFMEEYVDHNASITVSVRPHEWELVEEWMYENWDSCIGISFLALDDSYFQLMPYEAITEDEYNKRISEMKPFNPELLKKFENGEEHELETSECVGGVCPIK